MAMPVRKWMMNKFHDINKERMEKHLEILSEKSGKSKAYIKFDMFWNFILRGTGYTDYFRGDFIHLTPEEKDTFATARKFYKLMAYLNDEEYNVIFHDKLIFNELFRDYLRRDFINLQISTVEDFAGFLEGKEVVFAKDPTGECGHGISKIVVADAGTPETLYRELTDRGQLLVEEAIIQSEDLNEINPYVVNSYRIVTLYKDGRAKVISNALRINQDDTEVIGCTNDLYFSIGEDGRIDSNVIDDYANVYETHPMTGKKFSDVRIKGVKEAFQMCEKAALRVPQVRYIGWDVAFCEDGPVIVEGNEYPGYGILQFYALKGKRTGHLKEVADFLGDEYDKIKL